MYYLIGTGVVIFLCVLLVSVLSTQARVTEKKILMGLLMLLFSGFFVMNAIGGIKYNQMLGRGGPVSGKWLLRFLIPMNFLLGGATLYFAIQVWRGVMPVNM